ncbi:MAG: bifunctional phosphoribosyl-AMP cyclohydrolase/phosphoribosyl-ATP diphosphatase HisIE [Deltaproteobacteria bacterium]|nr:bifunctional phosphoribosyl-AMP cyclohydrolase/phosphoribosyl-ATP diphosphatase HisIE [Deltaproteobacteria bacterium]
MKLDFEKGGGLLPAIVQDAESGVVLMLGYMNREALEKTEAERRVTFWSRSKGRLWTKGESSGNFLEVCEILADCDGDTILIKAKPCGVVCHNGTDTCFAERNFSVAGLLAYLERIVKERRKSAPDESYTARLLAGGINATAQKVGEEAVELVIAAKDDDDQRFLDEAADLLFHYIVLLEARGKSLAQVAEVLRSRKKAA